MFVSESRPAGWPSHLFAVLIDATIFWAPSVMIVVLDFRIAPAVIPALVMLMAYWAMHGFGSTPGSFLAGFRFQRRNGATPGPLYGAVLTLVRTVAGPVMIIVAALAQGMPIPGLAGYPIVTHTTRSRGFFSGADRYWEKYRQRWE